MTRFSARRFFQEFRAIRNRTGPTTVCTLSKVANFGGTLIEPFRLIRCAMARDRRLEDRIRELSRQLVQAKNGEFDRVLAELRLAITEHSRRVNNNTAATVLAWPEFPGDRRRA